MSSVASVHEQRRRIQQPVAPRRARLGRREWRRSQAQSNSPPRLRSSPLASSRGRPSAGARPACPCNVRVRPWRRVVSAARCHARWFGPLGVAARSLVCHKDMNAYLASLIGTALQHRRPRSSPLHQSIPPAAAARPMTFLGRYCGRSELANAGVVGTCSVSRRRSSDQRMVQERGWRRPAQQARQLNLTAGGRQRSSPRMTTVIFSTRSSTVTAN